MQVETETGNYSNRYVHVVRGLAVAVCAAVVSMSLQGCTSYCGGYPPVTDYTLDLDALDERAGCMDQWNIWWGNPCASEVPVLWSKRGAEHSADWDYLTTNVENEHHICKDMSANSEYCSKWTVWEGSCSEEDFGECTCLTESSSGKYCERWQCIAKEAAQQRCYEACCGKGCTPCVMCNQPGEDPLPMNQEVYNELLSMDGIALGQSTQALTDELRAVHYQTPVYPRTGDCISSREIKYPDEIACGIWRVIETELSYCWCTADTDGEFCSNWVCEEKDTGLFSILFYHDMEYTPYVDGVERELGECHEIGADSTTSRLKCKRWMVHSDSYEESEVSQCEDVAGGCGGLECAYCDEYELKRVHFEDAFPRRYLFFWLHMVWMIPPLVILEGIAIVFGEEGGFIGGACCSLTGLCFYILLVYAIAFLRYEIEQSRYRSPANPWEGLWVSLLPAWAVGMILIAMMRYNDDEMPTFPGLVYIPVFMVICHVWACGIVPLLLSVAACCLVCLGCALMFTDGWRAASSASIHVMKHPRDPARNAARSLVYRKQNDDPPTLTSEVSQQVDTPRSNCSSSSGANENNMTNESGEQPDTTNTLTMELQPAAPKRTLRSVS